MKKYMYIYIFIYIYIYMNHFPVNIKLTQLCKSTILQLKITKKKNSEGKAPSWGTEQDTKSWGMDLKWQMKDITAEDV